jgi:hypothetical protein
LTLYYRASLISVFCVDNGVLCGSSI